MLSELPGSSNNRKCVLVEDNDSLKDLNNYLPNLLKYLWENPKLVAKLLSKSDKNDIKNNLASLIVNNFYENILSSNSVEDNLMYILALMLKEEINNLENINEPELFLGENSNCGCLLSELRKKNDIQDFLKIVILNAVDDLEINSSKVFNLNVRDIVNNCKKNNKEENKERNSLDKKDKLINPNELYKNKLEFREETNLNFEELKLKEIKEAEREKFNKFSEKYLATLTINEIKRMITEVYINNKNMSDYCSNQIMNCLNSQNNNDYYSNTQLMNRFYESHLSEENLYLYQCDFYKITEFIDQLLANLKNNLYLLPYSVKCICKIISILIQKKFPNINESQKNAYIADFLFKQLLKPILNNPAIGVLINTFIISRHTNINIQIINEILIRFVSGKFYRNDIESDYTPFNLYFLEKMPEIFEIFDKITKVTLPKFIDDLLNDKLNENFKYDYFSEKPDEVMFHRSICFNLHDISALLKNLDKCKDEI